MLQIVLVIGGVYLLIRGKLKASKNRVVTAKTARIVGAVFIIAASLPIFFGQLGVIAMLILAFVSAFISFLTSKKV